VSGSGEMSRFIKNPDEIILEDVKMIHYETMEEGRAVWLGIYLNNGKMYHLNIGGDNLYVNYSDETVEELAQGHTRKDLDAL
jgi:hypothetical protein